MMKQNYTLQSDSEKQVKDIEMIVSRGLISVI